MVGALLELKEASLDFGAACERIGITKEELEALGF